MAAGRLAPERGRDRRGGAQRQAQGYARPETEVFEPPRGKDIDVQTVVDLRRMLSEAGFGASGRPAVEDERSRDYGDSRWGSPK
jgi:hypothetical protein